MAEADSRKFDFEFFAAKRDNCLLEKDVECRKNLADRLDFSMP